MGERKKLSEQNLVKLESKKLKNFKTKSGAAFRQSLWVVVGCFAGSFGHSDEKSYLFLPPIKEKAS